MALKIGVEAIHTGKVAKHQLPASPLEGLDELLAKAPKGIPQPHWDKLSPLQKIKWYVDAAATPRYPLFESLLRDAGMPEKGTYTPTELAKLFQCSQRTLLDWRSKGLKPRDLPGGPRYFAEDIERFLQESGQ